MNRSLAWYLLPVVTYIFLPQMYLIQQDEETADKKYKYGTITKKDRKIFMDHIFFPCYRQSVETADSLRFTKDFEQSKKNNGYTTTHSVDFMTQRELTATVDRMRELVDRPENQHCFKPFRQFRFL